MLRPLLTFAFLLSLAGCERAFSPQQQQGSSGAPVASVSSPVVSASPRASASPDKPRHTPPERITVLSGKLGKEKLVRVYLEHRGKLIEGLLLVADGQPSRLVGTEGDGGLLSLDEVDAKGKPRSTLSGALQPQGATRLAWVDAGKKAKRERTLSLEANQPFKGEPPKGDVGYAGTLGARSRIRVQLTREGGKVAGFYRYAKSTEDLRLSGSVDEATGKVELTETTDKGVLTGKLTGTFISPSNVVGTWMSADGKRFEPFSIKAAKPLARVRDLGDGARLVPREASNELTPACSAEAEYAEITGLKSKAAEKALNDRLRVDVKKIASRDACEGAVAAMPYSFEESFDFTGQRGRFAGISLNSYSYAGGAHGTYGGRCHVADLDKGALGELGAGLGEVERAKLEALVNEKLQKEHGVADLTEAGFFEPKVKVAASPDLCLADDGVELRFSTYEVAPYAMGMPSVKLTLAEARPLLTGELARAALK